MKINFCEKSSFIVIGKEGSTKEGTGFIQRLWEQANSHISEIMHLAKRDEKGNVIGIWGAMSDLSHSFQPWEENFTKGQYLAGVECIEGAIPPPGWIKWVIPSYEYMYVENENANTFSEVISYLNEHHIPLVGAVHDFNCPKTQTAYLFFPIRQLD